MERSLERSGSPKRRSSSKTRLTTVLYRFYPPVESSGGHCHTPRSLYTPLHRLLVMHLRTSTARSTSRAIRPCRLLTRSMEMRMGKRTSTRVEATTSSPRCERSEYTCPKQNVSRNESHSSSQSNPYSLLSRNVPLCTTRCYPTVNQARSSVLAVTTNPTMKDGRTRMNTATKGSTAGG